MLVDLADPLEEGERFDLTLTFDGADDLVVDVEVRLDAP
jgi:copper(I)-binding protein